MTHSKVQHYGPLVGRVLIALLFLVSGFQMLTHFSSTAENFASVGVPFAVLALVIVLIVKLGGGLMLATGVHAREAAWALILFTLVTIVAAHLGEGQLIQALKNLAIIGGLLGIVVNGAGGFTLAKKCPCPRCKRTGTRSGGVCKPEGMCMCGTCETCTGASRAQEGASSEDTHDTENEIEQEERQQPTQ